MNKKRVTESPIFDYYFALENEIFIDVRSYQLLNYKPSFFGNLPRPTKWVKKTEKYTLITRVLVFIIWFLWNLGGAFIYFLYEFFKWTKASRKYQSENKTESLQDLNILGEYVLVLSTRAYELADHKNLGYNPASWIYMPWVVLPQKDNKKTPLINLLSFSTISDHLYALNNSIKSFLFSYNSFLYFRWNLQTYTAYKWFLVYSILSKIESGHFIIAEHYDRWAILADSLVRNKKFKHPQKTFFTVIQHGALAASLRNYTGGSGIGNHEDFEYKNLNRLASVDHIYVYDEQSALCFKKYILDFVDSKDLKINYFKPTIQLTDLHIENNDVKVLFVGHPLCENLQLFLLDEISKSFKKGIKIYYKPHPQASGSDSIHQGKWDIVKDKTIFPRVDLLISYASTLVTEYENMGIPALVHAIDLSPEQIKDFSAEVLTQVNLLVEKSF